MPEIDSVQQRRSRVTLLVVVAMFVVATLLTLVRSGSFGPVLAGRRPVGGLATGR